jgi:acyl-coenzyme A synthetase/AMP-(fatty) acid ligase
VLNARGREQLAARGRAAVVQQLRGHLAAHFEKVLLPRRWRFPERLPFDQRGKLPQAALSALFTVANDESAPAPRARRKTQGRE